MVTQAGKCPDCTRFPHVCSLRTQGRGNLPHPLHFNLSASSDRARSPTAARPKHRARRKPPRLSRAWNGRAAGQLRWRCARSGSGSLSPLRLWVRGGSREVLDSLGPAAGRWTWWLAAAPLSPVTESAQATRGRRPGCLKATRARAVEEDETMVNKVVLIGNLGRDPELIHTQGGRALARLWVATHEVWTKDGQRQRHTEWHRVLVWGARAEHIAAQYRKGTLVYVDGPIRSRKPTDGQPRTEIHAQL